MTRPPLLHCQDLCAWYGGAQILFNLNFSIAAGEVVALMGRHGAGKSTTLKSIMDMGPRHEGRVEFLGKDVSHRPSHALAQLGVAYVPEERRIFSDLSVLENLSVGRQAARVMPYHASPSQPSQSKEQVKEVLGTPLQWDTDAVFDLFPALAAKIKFRGSTLSGGEQQMLSVARALMGNPLLLLLDEPSEGMAPMVVEQMAQMILKLKSLGMGVLLCEQNADFAYSVSDSAYVLDLGELSDKTMSPWGELIKKF